VISEFCELFCVKGSTVCTVFIVLYVCTLEKPDIMEKYDSIPSLGEQQTSSRVFTGLVFFAEVI